MRLDATIRGVPLAQAGAWAAKAEALGFDAMWTTETDHDPFFPLVAAAGTTSRLGLGTGVALAFPRSPATLAYQAYDLQALSEGRFLLGLGAQVRAHVERRFSAAYDRPAARMRELIAAIRAIWQAWDGEGPLRFEGEFYRHTLMPPAFVPGRFAHGRPPIVLAAVQARMTEVAGEVADALAVHPLQTAAYIAEKLVPALRRGADRAGRDAAEIEVHLALFVALDEAEREDVRRRVAFYATTPQYRAVLETHGYARLGEQLHELSRRGEWDAMAALVPDELLELTSVCASSADAAVGEIRRRYSGLVDRVNLHAGEYADLDRWADIARAWKAA